MTGLPSPGDALLRFEPLTEGVLLTLAAHSVDQRTTISEQQCHLNLIQHWRVLSFMQEEADFNQKWLCGSKQKA